MTLYGDLDISTIDELPAGRLQVRTRWVPQNRRADAYQFVRGQVSEGRQAFVVCPLIDESASIEARAATEEYERLSQGGVPGPQGRPAPRPLALLGTRTGSCAASATATWMSW